jgi:hypothetical protein
MRWSLPAALLGACIALSACGMFGGGPMPPIVGAAREGDLTRLAQLLNAGADPNIHAGVNDWTPLMHAIHKGQRGSVRVLVAHGARPDERGRGGATALIMAAGYGYDDVVRILLKAGADPHLKSYNGESALDAAVGGTSDIDRFTVGHCQIQTVRALLAAAPDLTIAPSGDAVRVAKFSGCTDVVALVTKKR